MEKLFTLLALQRQVLEASTRPVCLHLIVNETLRLVPYQQAVFWESIDGDISLQKVSGNVVLDHQGIYAEAIRSKIKSIISDASHPVIQFSYEQKMVCVVLFKGHDRQVIGGLWLENDRDFLDAEVNILEELSVSYAAALLSFSRQRFSLFSFHQLAKIFRYKKRILFLMLFLFFLPVRQTITAPAEIVAREADIITAPYDGMIDKIVVDPGDSIEEGQVVAVMEEGALRSQVDLAQQALVTAEASLARLQREALGSADKKADMNSLQAEISEKKIEYNYAVTMLERMDIKASRSGYAVFADARKMQGKPVRTGEAIMMIADPEDSELLVRVPLDNLVPVHPGAGVEFYMNVAPIFGHDAVLKSIGYQASVDPDGMLTYKLRAKIIDRDDLRIGWQGTARIQGNWTILSYALFRRPLAVFRHLTGI